MHSMYPMQVRYQAALRPELLIMPEKIQGDSNLMMDCNSFLNDSGIFCTDLTAGSVNCRMAVLSSGDERTWRAPLMVNPRS